MTIFRYLTREVFSSTFAVSIVLVLILLSARFVKYLAEAAAGTMDAGILLTVMAYSLPAYLELILPLGLFLGIMMAYGRLYLESEMAILSACGVSRRRILFYSLIMSLLIAAIVGTLSLYLAPKGVKATEDLLIEARNRNELENIKPARFHKLSGGKGVSYAESLSKDKSQLKKVFFAHQAEKAEGGGFAVLMAEEGEVVIDKDSGGKYLALKKGKRYVGEPGENDFRIVEFESYSQRLAAPDYSEVQSKKATDALSTQTLFDLSSPQARAALQWRLSVPLIVIVVTLLAVPLSRTQPRQGRYAKMLPAIILYILYLVSLNAARGAIENNEAPIQGLLWWVHALFFGIAVLLNGWDSIMRLLSRDKHKQASAIEGAIL